MSKRKVISVSFNDREMSDFNNLKKELPDAEHFDLSDSQYIKFALRYMYKNIDDLKGQKNDK